MVLPTLNFIPFRKCKTSNRRFPRLNPFTMFTLVGANNLYVDVPRPRVPSHAFPLISRSFDGIARVRDHVHTQAEIVGSNSIGQPIAFGLYINPAKIPKGLLDCVNPEMSSLEFDCESLGEGGFSCSRQSREDIQRRHLAFTLFAVLHGLNVAPA